VEKKRVLVVRAVREAVAATRYMIAVVIVGFCLVDEVKMDLM